MAPASSPSRTGLLAARLDQRRDRRLGRRQCLRRNLVVRSENFFNAVKMLLLAAFVVAGLLTPMEWSRLGPENFVTPLGLVAGAMLIFLEL